MSISGVSATGAAQGQSPLASLIAKVTGAAGGVDADGDHDGSSGAAKPAAASATPAPAPSPGSTVTRYA